MDTTCNDGKRKAAPPAVAAAAAAAAAALQPGDGDEPSILVGAATLDIDASDANDDNDRRINDNNMGIDDDDNNNSRDNTNKNNDDGMMIPPPVSKFQVFDKVIARDKDGLMYDAVIRRCLYGSAEPQQIPIGLFSNAEAEAILRKRQEQDQKQQQLATTANGDATTSTTDSEPPAWHYFVHYNKWAVNWDRWVSQDDVYEPTDKIQAYAARIQKEHKDLSNQLATSKPGKKKRQTIDGHAFLGQWRLRLECIDAEMDMYNPLISPFSTTAAGIKKSKKQDKAGREENEEEHDGDDNKKSKKGKQRGQQSASAANSTAGANIDSWSPATLAAEMKNRIEHNLTNMRQPAVAKKLVLPFALHKILVDQWEIIGQCNMLPSLPAPVTVRQILNRYLASKQQQQQQPAVQLDDIANTTTTENAEENASPTQNSTVDNNSNMGISPSLASAKSPPTTEPNSRETNGTKEGTAGTSLPEDGKGRSSETKQEAPLEQEKNQDTIGEKDPLQDSPENSSNDDVPQEFIEMAEGIASFFDKALPTRLLYRQEIPQLRVLDAILPEECQDKRLSEIYGGEHLLRLFIRLPEALVDGFSAAAAAARSKSKSDMDDFQDPSPRILALLSDFARFLHKHQATLFCQSHRKWTAIELKEQQKMTALQQRRKRASQQQQQPPPTPSSIASTSTSKNDDDHEGKVETDSSKRSKSPPSSQRGRKRPKKSPTN